MTDGLVVIEAVEALLRRGSAAEHEQGHEERRERNEGLAELGHGVVSCSNHRNVVYSNEVGSQKLSPIWNMMLLMSVLVESFFASSAVGS